MLRKVHRKLFDRTSPFQTFLEPGALAINEARMNHLASLGLPLDGRSVLEVGAGIGLLTEFFESRGCTVTSTDARADNIRENIRRHPWRRVLELNLEKPAEVDRLGKFDVVFCYGTLYHVAAPEAALEAMARVSDMILLETCLSPGEDDAVKNVNELNTASQAFSTVGSRPTRTWIINRLERFWGHGYISLTQPAHADFPLTFSDPQATLNIRAIFVGSRTPLASRPLSPDIPATHTRAGT